MLMLMLMLITSSYNRVTGTAEARLFSMFKFPDSNRVHFQCDIVICKGDLGEDDDTHYDNNKYDFRQCKAIYVKIM